MAGAAAALHSPTVRAAGDQIGTLKPGVAVLAIDAAILTMVGSSVRGNLQVLVGIPVTVLGCAVAWTAAAGRPPLLRPLSVTYSLLAIAAAIGVVVPLPHGALWYEILFRAYPIAGIIAVGVARGGDARLRRRAVLALAVSAVLLHALAPVGVPRPTIDVWNWTQATSQALLRGVHPYTITAIDPYAGAYDYGSTPTVYPYMPAVLLLSTPALALLGDYRYALALCLPATLWLFTAAATKLETDDEITSVAMLTLVLHPRGALLTALGFTDLFLVAVAAAFLYFAASGRRVAEAVAFLMLPALKQYVAAPVVIYVALRRRWRAIALGALAAVATAAPFLLWNARATLAGMLYLVQTPIGFRIDSDSLTALVARLWGVTSPRWIAIAAQFAAAGVAGWMLRDQGLGGVLLASALSLLVCFLVATQAFANYYAFAAALLVFAAAPFASRTAAGWE